MPHPIDPIPKKQTVKHLKPYSWSCISYRNDYCELPTAQQSIDNLFKSRRTNYPARSLPPMLAMSLIRETCRYRFLSVNMVEKRAKTATVSAGALHTISVMLISKQSPPLLYNRETDKCFLLSVLNPKELSRAINVISNAAKGSSGDYLLFVADKEKINSFYDSANTLIFRDCGALLQNLSLHASAVGYAFVPLGPLGQDALNAIDDSKDRLMAVGTALIGLQN